MTLKELNQYGAPANEDAIRKLPTYHAIILATEYSREDITCTDWFPVSHLEYFARRPRIPKSVF